MVLLAPAAKVSGESVLITATALNLPQSKTPDYDIPLQPLDALEQQLIRKALAVTNGHVAKAAPLLGLSRNAMYRRLEKFGIVYDA